nr:MAG TPA: hypothetical protein [Caudoviricetes sp.]
MFSVLRSSCTSYCLFSIYIRKLIEINLRICYHVSVQNRHNKRIALYQSCWTF